MSESLEDCAWCLAQAFKAVREANPKSATWYLNQAHHNAVCIMSNDAGSVWVRYVIVMGFLANEIGKLVIAQSLDSK